MKILRMKAKLLPFLLLEVSLANSKLSPHSLCLLNKKLYHQDTQSCYHPLQQGPCSAGEWLVLGAVPGEGVCTTKIVCKPGLRPVLDPDGGAGCGCPEGQEQFGGSCETLYSSSVCGEGKILLPENFNIGNKICSNKFSSKKINNCPAFQTTKLEIARRGTHTRKLQVSYLKEIVCDKKTKAVCCPDYNKESLFSPENLIQSLVPPKVLCSNNPCPLGKWPWVGQDGVSRCLYRDRSIGDCNGDLVEEDGTLICKRFSLRTVAPIFRRNCGRRRIFINGRCRRIF